MGHYMEILDRETVLAAVTKALLAEVYTTPKPGLVDRHDNGAHTDMDVHTFERSTYAIAPYLADMYAEGLRSADPQSLFRQIRAIGMRAEKAMYAATADVNTHKGMLFTVGILCAAIGYAQGRGMPVRAETVLEQVPAMTAEILEAEFEQMSRREARTHGEILFHRTGERGIRGQAQKGFPVLRDTAVPALRKYLRLCQDTEEAYLRTLMEIIAVLNDTNVLSRGNEADLQEMQHRAGVVLRLDREPFYGGLADMNQWCIGKNLSPGGAADLLAAAILLIMLEK